MSSVYPGSLDHLSTSLTSTTSMSGHAALHDLLADALNEVQLQQFNTIFNVRSYGAKGDVKKVTDGAMTSGQPTLTSATAAFTVADVGKLVGVTGAGSGATPNLASSISAYVSATQVTLAANAASNVSGAVFKYGTDDTTAVQAANTAACAVRGTLYFPPGFEYWSAGVVVTDGVKIEGGGWGSVWGCKPALGTSGALVISKNPTTQTTSRVTVRNLKMIGNSAYQWGGGPITNANNTFHAVKGMSALYWLVDGVWAEDFDGDGYYFGGGNTLFHTSDHNTVINSVATLNLRNGGFVENGAYNSFINVRFIQNQAGDISSSPKFSLAMYDSAELDIEPSQTGEVGNYTLIQGCRFMGNLLSRGIQINRTNPVLNTQILDCLFFDCLDAISVTGVQVKGTLIQGCVFDQTTPGTVRRWIRCTKGANDFKVVNNYFHGGCSGASTSSAIQVDDSGTDRPQRFKFVGNTFDATGFGTGDGHTILLSACDLSEVWGNELLNGATLDDRTPATTNTTVKTSLGISSVGGVDDNGLPGVTAPGGGSGWFLGRQALTSNKAYFSRIYPVQGHVITLVEFTVTTPSGTDDPFEIAIYDSTGTTKLATTGQVTTSGKLNAGGNKTQALSYTLVAGTAYYVAFAATSTATLACAMFDVLANATPYGQPFPKLLFGDTTAAYPLPASLTAAGSLSFVPKIVLRES